MSAVDPAEIGATSYWLGPPYGSHVTGDWDKSQGSGEDEAAGRGDGCPGGGEHGGTGSAPSARPTASAPASSDKASKASFQSTSSHSSASEMADNASCNMCA